MQPGAVVIGGYVNGLGVARALAAEGIGVALVRTQPYDIAHRSRAVDVDVPCFEMSARPEALYELLIDRAAEWRGRVILPTNDGAVEVVARRHAELSSHYRLTTPPWEIVQPLLRKDLFEPLARRAGVELPRTFGAADDECLAMELDFPLLLKPAESHRFYERFGVKLFLVRDREELARGVARLSEAGLCADLVELVPGPDTQYCDCYVYIGRSGELLADMQLRRVRKGPTQFGLARVARVFEHPDLVEPTLAVLRLAGFHGLGLGEFKIDPRDGKPRLLEVNVRSCLSIGSTVKTGLNLPAMAWREAVEGTVGARRSNGWDGLWIHLHADLLYWLFHRDQDGVSLRDLLATYRPGRKLFAVWSTRDPAPFFSQWGTSLRQVARTRFQRPSLRRGRAAKVQHAPPAESTTEAATLQ